MFWLIRWTDFRTFKEHSMVVEAESREEAEAIARKRRVTPTYVGPADEAAVAQARSERKLWSWESDEPLAVLGRPVAPLQLAVLILLGISTIGILLQATGLLASVKLAL